MDEKNNIPQNLHITQVPKLTIFINRAHILIHSTALLFFFFHFRASFFFFNSQTLTPPPLLLILFAAELILSLQWLLAQASRWRPVHRTALPDGSGSLPAVDVFLCTADPEKEPTAAVMNTVLSAMAMDYPPEKLAVYLSDDGGSPAVLAGAREAWGFAKLWVPFRRRYKVDSPCPEAYFSGDHDSIDIDDDDEFKEERERIKREYEAFKDRVEEYARVEEKRKGINDIGDHPAFIEVMQENSTNVAEAQIPLLVYVSREKRPSHSHHFKAGALNVLNRVSGVMSNAPYMLVLDCDMYCNDTSVARRAMCFHLDPIMSRSLAFVQFPQRFRNISPKSDIYDSRIRSAFSVQWQGMDGLGGPILSGTGFFMKRLALCSFSTTTEQDNDPVKLRQDFGPSNEFVKSLIGGQNYKPKMMINNDAGLLQEMRSLASCTYEIGTKWGEEVGFLYGSVVEDFLTGFALQCKGWASVYCCPKRAQFLGCGVTSLNDLLIQSTRWSSGLIDVGMSKYCPFLYGLSRISILRIMCYADIAFMPLSFFPVWCFATIPQLCLLNGVPVYPEVPSTFFALIMFMFLSASSKYLYEVLATEGSFGTYMNEQRVWMMKSVTSHLYGSVDAVMKRIGLRQASFWTTNKARDDNERESLYQKGLYDFHTSNVFLVPIVSLVILNIASFLVGIGRTMVFVQGDLEKMFVQIFLSFYVLVVNYPVIEGMVIRKDNGSIPWSVTGLSALCCVVLWLFVSIIFFS